MANIIKPKRTNTAGNTPTTANLTSGELGVNMADQKTYINNGTAVVQIGAGNLTGLGDVVVTSPTNAQALVYNTATGKWINGTGSSSGTVTSVAATVPSFLSVAGSPITTSGTIAITYSGLALPIANGGTGQTTATAAFNALAPSQTSNSGKYLTTDGTNTSWATVAGGGINSVVAISSPVTTAISITTGQLGLSLGPIVVNTGGSVTVGTGQQWVVL